MTPADLATGLLAALEAPRWLRAPGLEQLLAPPTDPRVEADARDALRVARRALRLLSRLDRFGGAWRDTCLLRSVIACLVFRRRGVPAVLKLGARAIDPGSITAHAWVERPDGRLLAEAPLAHTPLHPTS